MRIAIAALLGAIVFFVWQFLAHMVLPIGQMGFRLPQNEDVVLQSVTTGLPTPGIYYLPSIDPARMGDAAAMSAWEEKASKNPYVFAVVNTPTQNAKSMTRQLAVQFVTDLLAAFLAAWVLGSAAFSFGARVVGTTAIGIFGWLMNIVPQWNWYRFPKDFLLGNLLEQGIGWLVAGFLIAWWLGRGPQRRLR